MAMKSAFYRLGETMSNCVGRFEEGDVVIHPFHGKGKVLFRFCHNPTEYLYNVKFDDGICVGDVSGWDLILGEKKQMIKIYSVDFFERLKVPENRIYELRGAPISGHVQVYALNMKCNRISISHVNTINNFIYIPDEFKIDSEIEIEYSYDTKGDDREQMTKSDLKTGMRVKYRNGFVRVILLDTTEGDIVQVEMGSSFSLTRYNEDLTVKYGDKNFDIMEVYQCDPCQILTDKVGNLIWKRTEVPKIKEITMDEVEDKFGCKVKIVNKI
jgi:hypothetical protein